MRRRRIDGQGSAQGKGRVITLPFPPASLSGHNARTTVEDRFWKRVRIASNESCWQWIGEVSIDGYGRFWVRKGHRIAAHRVSWMLANKVTPTGVICHSCDNPGCVNPAHLWHGTQADNMRDKVSKGRQWHFGQTHCKYGHEFTPENTRHRKDRVGRCCRTCDRISKRRKKVI